MSQVIYSCAQAIAFGRPVEEIREILVAGGRTEESAYLIYCAAKVFLASRETDAQLPIGDDNETCDEEKVNPILTS